MFQAKFARSFLHSFGRLWMVSSSPGTVLTAGDSVGGEQNNVYFKSLLSSAELN